ncbi:uncharacterized protein C8R40DRAFT_1263493 [Lentinula edodes]|uniref:uncharacterized protein n=1 Tax=Lentinula edodes TaxID=5353 RepID=UPI001E8DAED6|nr:uncharacterized protein C8R40DRAFT_1263493 [Lentinula edodes]KAH7878113.1 hypothetical protein C8R40DRAFT_1263493 [Lentinula edodes]
MAISSIFLLCDNLPPSSFPVTVVHSNVCRANVHKINFIRSNLTRWIGSCVWIRKKKKNVESIVTIEEEEEYFEGEDELTTTKNILTAKAELCSQVTAFMGVLKDILISCVVFAVHTPHCLGSLITIILSPSRIGDLWYRLDRRSRQTNSAGFNLAEERYRIVDNFIVNHLFDEHNLLLYDGVPAT